MSFRELLNSWNLEKYGDAFELGGWEDPVDWKELSEKELRDDCQLSKGHIKKFLRKYAEWRAVGESKFVKFQKYVERLDRKYNDEIDAMYKTENTGCQNTRVADRKKAYARYATHSHIDLTQVSSSDDDEGDDLALSAMPLLEDENGARGRQFALGSPVLPHIIVSSFNGKNYIESSSPNPNDPNQNPIESSNLNLNDVELKGDNLYGTSRISTSFAHITSCNPFNAKASHSKIAKFAFSWEECVSRGKYHLVFNAAEPRLHKKHLLELIGGSHRILWCSRTGSKHDRHKLFLEKQSQFPSSFKRIKGIAEATYVSDRIQALVDKGKSEEATKECLRQGIEFNMSFVRICEESGGIVDMNRNNKFVYECLVDLQDEIEVEQHERAFIKEFEELDLYTYQRETLAVIKEFVDARAMDSFANIQGRGLEILRAPTGNEGKTYLLRYIAFKFKGYFCERMLKEEDFADSYPKRAQVLCLDIAKGDVNTCWATLERVKNGILTSGKYHGKRKVFAPPFIIIATNSEVPIDAFSQDRIPRRQCIVPRVTAARTDFVFAEDSV